MPTKSNAQAKIRNTPAKAAKFSITMHNPIMEFDGKKKSSMKKNPVWYESSYDDLIWALKIEGETIIFNYEA